jgi:hypothetical protein
MIDCKIHTSFGNSVQKKVLTIVRCTLDLEIGLQKKADCML